jgi:sugar phosphate isomerase/epimerase
MITRRSFFQTAGAVAVAAASGQALAAAAAESAKPASSDGGAAPFRFGVAGFTFSKLKLDPSLEMMAKVDAHYLCIKDFHLPLKSTDEEIAAFHAKCKASQVTGYAVGPIYVGSEAEVEQAFAYAKRVGVSLLVGVPFKKVDGKRVADPELVKFVDKKVREYDIRFAIHNHGPDMPELFPSAESAMEMIQNLDVRVGLCLDIGHEFRDGKDPIAALSKFKERVHEIHLKNVTGPNKRGHAIELPRGEIDLAAFVRMLRKVEYRGVCALEYEKDMENPLTGIAESIGYFRGLVDATR